jgi:hypothetical protein
VKLFESMEISGAEGHNFGTQEPDSMSPKRHHLQCIKGF